MKKHDLLENDVDLKELASLTKNFSGAEIAGTYSFYIYAHN
jgi:vesicle-fusing ATPase